jgi:hypothetical protein
MLTSAIFDSSDLRDRPKKEPNKKNRAFQLVFRYIDTAVVRASI